LVFLKKNKKKLIISMIGWKRIKFLKLNCQVTEKMGILDPIGHLPSRIYAPMTVDHFKGLKPSWLKHENVVFYYSLR